MDGRSQFRASTYEALLRCADWITENAYDLSDEFSGGCKDWRIEFCAGDDGLFPCVEVRFESTKCDLIPCGIGDTIPYTSHRRRS